MFSVDHNGETIDICELYEIPRDSIEELMERYRGKPLLLHAPDGLKPLYKCIQKILGNRCDLYFSSSPGYGACDIPFEEAEAIGAGLIIHIGHSKYVFELRPKPEVEVFYLPVYYKVKPPNAVLIKLDEELKSHGVSKLTVSSTLIEIRLRNYIANYLRDKGYEVFEIQEPILGCYYGKIIDLDSVVDMHIVISGGLFHPYGLGLISNKKILAFDPYSWRMWIVNTEVEKILRKRLFILNKLKHEGAKRIGIVIGSRPGQCRPLLVKYLEELATSANMSVYKIISTYVNTETLASIDNAMNLDLYIVTSCPRLPIDDLGDFHKPVLTPGEFIVITKDIEKYIYPW